MTGARFEVDVDFVDDRNVELQVIQQGRLNIQRTSVKNESARPSRYIVWSTTGDQALTYPDSSKLKGRAVKFEGHAEAGAPAVVHSEVIEYTAVTPHRTARNIEISLEILTPAERSVSLSQVAPESIWEPGSEALLPVFVFCRA